MNKWTRISVIPIQSIGNVVCVECRKNPLTFHASSGIAVPGGYFGPGKGRIWLNDLRCLGDTWDINDCVHSGWMQNNCNHYEDAGVVCTDAEEAELKLIRKLLLGAAFCRYDMNQMFVMN